VAAIEEKIAKAEGLLAEEPGPVTIAARGIISALQELARGLAKLENPDG
jgi:hypothetical protein